VNHLLIAGSIKPRAMKNWIGDGLVPPRSALGEHREPTLRLGAPRLQRTHIEPLGHVAMLGDARVYDALRDWLSTSIAGG
jgi:hypothetical protein